MLIEGLIYADETLIKAIEKDLTLSQVANVATLPGMVGRSLAMPDAHQGYGFAIGGVAAADLEHGVVSAGGVGFDINCGVRLLASSLHANEVRPVIEPLLNQLFRDIPCGTGKSGIVAMSFGELDGVLETGARWAVKAGYGTEADLNFIEEHGCLQGADPSTVSQRAKQRGKDQLGTLGSGNHFVEVQVIDEIFDEQAASAFGLEAGMVTVLIHTGSRGLGHFAFANRQMITHWTREAFQRIVGRGDLWIVYDVAHNIAKVEEHTVDGRRMRVLVHRKGATRAFPAGRPEIPKEYAHVGQPVLIPGSMGTSSYVLVGTEKAMEETFGSSCHGAGRAKSRTAAKKEITAEELLKQLKERGIHVRGASKSGLTEENPNAYKDVSAVVDVVDKAGIAKKVARLIPMGVIKG